MNRRKRLPVAFKVVSESSTSTKPNNKNLKQAVEIELLEEDIEITSPKAPIVSSKFEGYLIRQILDSLYRKA